MLAIKNVMQRYFAFSLAILMIVLGGACSPSGPKALLQGEQLIKKGDYPAAVKKLEIASQKLPNYPQVWNFLGLAYHKQGNPGEAVASYQKALSLDRNFSATYYNLGLLFLELNRLPDALSTLTSFTILQPNSEDAWLKLAAIQLRLQKPDDAERATAQALKLNPNNPEAYNNLGLSALQRRKSRDALQLFDKALHLKGDYAPSILNQAVILHGMPGSKPLALQRYRAYLSLEPNSKEAQAVRQTISVLEAELSPPPLVVRTNTPPIASAQTNAMPANIVAPPPQLAPQTQTNRAIAIHEQNPHPSPLPSDGRGGRTRNETNPVAGPPPTFPATNKSPAIALTGTNRPIVQTPPATNILDPQPHSIKSIRTNAVAAVAPPSSATNAAPAEAKLADTTPTVPLETVNVQEDLALKPVRDVTPGTASPAATNTVSNPINSSTNRNVAISRIGRDREDKPGVLERMNPASWFRTKSKAEESQSAAIKPAPPIKTNAPMTTAAAPAIRPAPPAEPKPAPEIPRYPYKRQMNLPEGDRATAEAAYNRAVTAHQEKRLAAAMEFYLEAIKQNPAYFQAYYNLGLAAYQLRDLPLAMSAGEAAVFLRPGSVDARYNFALALRDANYFADAANQLRELLVDSPDDVRAHFTIANIYAQQMNQPSMAMRHYLKVLELDARHPQAAQIRYWLSRAN